MAVFQIIYDEKEKQDLLLNDMPYELQLYMCEHIESIELFEDHKLDFTEIFTKVVREAKSNLFENEISVLNSAEKWLNTHKISHFNAININDDGVIRHILSFGDKNFTDDIQIQFIINNNKVPTYTQNIRSTYALLCFDHQQTELISPTLAKIYYFIELSLTNQFDEENFNDLSQVEVDVIACIITFIYNAVSFDISLQKLDKILN